MSAVFSRLTKGSAAPAWRRQLDQRWQALAPRERRGLLLAGLALGGLLLWMVAVRPAWNVLRSAPPQRAALEGQLAQMRGLAAEARELRALPPVAPE
ncbi:MAG TPA: type II secretion system protein GspM, partial [Burkholderiaceae bacterium]|nr:type II secretion system protein GspM [Burkholderiaceae bacterium]